MNREQALNEARKAFNEAEIANDEAKKALKDKGKG